MTATARSEALRHAADRFAAPDFTAERGGDRATLEFVVVPMLRAWADGLCCDLHNVHCETPSELCCIDCTEVDHPRHRPGQVCVLDAARAAP